ncbi:MAG: PDZ domain-containing protein [Gemmataceae bacterium]|nr:PDZ domain-containing protein [Gemmataceae bacterium]
MSDFWLSAAQWTMQSMIAGGTALLLGWLAARRIAEPARRHRAMGWSVRAAVLACGLALLPGWWKLSVAGWGTSAEERAAEAARVEFQEADIYIVPQDEVAFSVLPIEQAKPAMAEPILEFAPLDEPEPDLMVENTPAFEEAQVDRSQFIAGVAKVLLVPYWLFVLMAVLRQVVGYFGLARLCRTATPAGERIEKLSCEIADLRLAPRILVSDRLASPVCFGVFRPTIILPRTLVRTATEDELRWVLAHELDHLRRGDPRTGVWVGLARALYFPFPWFWAVRREISLTQEYLADAAAAGARAADYAAFLVELSSRPGVSRFVRAVPSLAGVRAGQSDLYRRVTMLLESNGGRKTRGGRVWTTAAIASAVTAAVALSGMRLTADEPKRDKKPDGETRVEVIVKDKKDGDKKPADTVRDVEVVVVADMSKQTAEIEKAIEDAAKKGEVEEVKKLVAKLKAITMAPQIARMKLPAVPVPPKPPLPPDAVAKVREVRVVVDAEAKKLEEALEKLKKAAEEVKDQPEAKAALERTMAEYRKKIAEAQAKGHLKLAEAAKDQKGQQLLFRMDGGDGVPEQIRKNTEDMMRAYQKQIEALKGDEKAIAAVKEAMAKYKESMEALHKQMAQFPKIQQFQWQGGAPNVAFVEGQKGLWIARAAAAEKGRLGVTIEPVPAVLVEQLDLPKGQGVIIAQVFEGTPAAKAGLKTNDVVIEVAGKSVTVEELPKVVAGLKNDQAFDVIVIRKGKKEAVKGVTIPSPKDSPAKDKVKDGARKASQSSMSVSVNDDQFEIVAKEDGLAYMIKGTVGDDANTSIVIAEGEKKSTYQGVKSVPAEHREKVAKLLKSVGGRK